ncbi:MAG TPA: pyridoxamine 5'-phosphate oxidase family protein [Candidatus Limnocylindrales bacterium]|nr:pyridoxamine 5'-phosphate oxidase family protein [Candidatus Limnocylindrales bacterium]
MSGPGSPSADRPHMPGYGILPAGAGGGLLPWSWAVQRLENAHNYWVATTGRGGAPHLAAVWGLWDSGAFHFSTGGESRKARNLTADPRCVVTPENAGEAVVVEGVAHRVVDSARLDELQALYQSKYGSGFPDPEGNPVFRVEPHAVFGMIEQGEDFVGRATRWRFPTP